jgi:hypothetical protein
MEITFVNIIAQILGAVQAATAVASVQFKARSRIVLMMALSGAFLCFVLALLGSYGSLVMAAFGTSVALVAYLFDRHGKSIPCWLLGLYMVGLVAIAAWLYQDWRDLLVLAAQLAFVMEMAVKKEQSLRCWVLVNMTFWIIYNLLIGAFTPIIGNVFLVASTVIAMVRYRDKT